MTANYGVTKLYAGINPTVDIVAVHGLYGHALKTWTSKGSTVPWLGDKDMLPKALPNARILTWGYNADVHSFMGSTSSDTILEHAHTLVAQLQADREVWLALVPGTISFSLYLLSQSARNELIGTSHVLQSFQRCYRLAALSHLLT